MLTEVLRDNKSPQVSQTLKILIISVLWLFIYFSFIIHFLDFFTTAFADDLLQESWWNQVSWTLLSILADLGNAVVWIVSICPAISKSSSPFTNPLVTVPRAPITIGITVTFMFHSSWGGGKFPSKVEILITLYALFQFHSLVNRDSKVHNPASSFYYYYYYYYY